MDKTTPHDEISKILVKWNMPTRQAAISDLVKLFEAHTQQLEKAYGGCHNCYGKGYATVNDRWHGYATDGDIGGLEGHISGGNHNAMKFCRCSRGKQLRERIKAHTQAARLDEVKNIDLRAPTGGRIALGLGSYIEWRLAQLESTKEDKS